MTAGREPRADRDRSGARSGDLAAASGTGGRRWWTRSRTIGAGAAALLCLVALVAALVVTGRSDDDAGLAGPVADAAPAPVADRQLPLRAAYYYPWFPETDGWATHFTPTLGRYDSSDDEVLATHVAQAEYAGLDAFISSWIRGRATAARLSQLLDAAAAQDFAVAAYYEREGLDDPSVAEIRADLAALPTDHPAYLHVDGKPVLFVRNGGDSDCSLVDRWREAAPDWYLSLRVFPDFAQCPAQPDAWHQYAPSTPYSTHGRYHATVSPGLWRSDEPDPRLARDPTRFRADLARAVDSGADWQMVTSFNQWGEGSSVEPAEEWASPSGYGTYLDAMHDAFAPGGPEGAAASGGPAPRQDDDVVVMAAGDISCDPADSSRAEMGEGTKKCAQGRVARQVAAAAPDAVLALGDNQYEDGTVEQYRDSYDLTWGPLKPITYPAPGNHEWLSDAKGYRDYFDEGTPDEVDVDRGYYSVDLGAWHVVSLDSDCSKVGGCGAGSPMYEWLRGDLAAHDGRPTLVFWHHPRWSSGVHGSLAAPVGPLWEAVLADRDVQVLLSGHDHDYERFAPMGSSGPDAGGVRQFVLGTGGKNHTCPTSLVPGSEVADCSSFGALQITLHPDGSYDWLFTAAPGTGSFTDRGTQPRR